MSSAILLLLGFAGGLAAPKLWAEACRRDRLAAMKGETRGPR